MDHDSYPVQLPESTWREILSPAEFHVLREGGTEPPFVGAYTDDKREGIYRCRGCDSELFTSQAKFDSHCGWPSFYAPVTAEAVEYIDDTSLGMTRTEIRCRSCGSHLGHVFQGEGYDTPTDLRFCINSLSLDLNGERRA